MSKRRSRKSKSVPPGEIDHLAEALRLIETFPPLESLDELQDKYIRVMRTGIATTPQEERMLAEIEEFRRKIFQKKALELVPVDDTETADWSANPSTLYSVLLV